MIISCSHCQTSYEVDASYFEPDGRKVKCSSCSTVWFQPYKRPEDVIDVEKTSSDSPVAGVKDQLEDTTGDQEDSPGGDIKSEAQRLVAAAKNIKAQRLRGSRQMVSAMIGWGSLAATIAVVAGLSIYFRLSIVKALPGSAQLYAQLGMPVNVRGMAFANVVYKRDFENGLPVLAIKGEVVNLTGKKLELPRVRFGLLDATDQELYHWSTRIDKKPIGPYGHVKFVTRLASPPKNAQGLIVRFAKATTGYGAYR